MRFSTGSRVAPLSIFSLALVCLLASISFAQVVNVPLSSLFAPGGVTQVIPEPVAGQLFEQLTIIIGGAVFPPNFTGEVDLLEPIGTNGVLSDRILFDNSSGIATVTFLSDDEQGNLPLGPVPPYPLLIPSAFEPAPAVVMISLIDLNTNTILPLTVTMFSDIDTPLFDPRSDSITLSVPEPNTAFLTGLGLSGLAAVALRRRWAKIVR